MKKSLNRRLTVYFVIIMALTVVISVAWNYYSTRLSILEMEKEQAEGFVKAGSALLDHYGDYLREDRDSEDYQYLRNALQNFCNGFGQEAIYLYTVDSGTGSHNILMTVHHEGKADIPRYQEADRLPLPMPEAALDKTEKELLTGEERLQRVVWRSGFDAIIMWVSVYSDPGTPEPVFIGMKYSTVRENRHILRDFLADTLLPIIAVGFAFMVLNLMIRERVATPIRYISERMNQYAHSSSVRPEPLNIHNEDEIGEIASAFESMTEEITAYIGNIEKLTQERVETNVQLDVARRIQYGLVPAKTTLNDSAFRICAMTRPAKAVGGDFYDCFKRDDGSICIVMGDVSGKGITGAIVMAMIKTVIREKLTLGLSPAETLNQTNKEMIDQNPEGLFATVFAAVLDPCTGDLRYANAGHTWPVLLGSEPAVLKPDPGIALGLFEDADIRDETMKLLPGQGMILYTDGLTDALNVQRVPFGMERLLGTSTVDPEASDPSEDLLLRISKTVGTYCEGVEPFDDMAALVLFMTDAAAGEDETLIPVSLSSFEEVKEAVFNEAGDTPATRQALLACDEALSNIVRYSGADEMAFRCRKEDDTLSVVFSDNGIAFDPTAAPAAEKDFEQLDSGGMGISLIREITSSVSYERKDNKNLFTMNFPI